MRTTAPGLTGTIALVAALGAVLWLAPAGSALADSPESCATLIADPAPGYKGPILHGFACDYRPEAPAMSWTVPAGVSEAQLHLNGADHQSGRGGEVRATLPVTPGETLSLVVGHEGSATMVSRGATRLLVAAGGDGKEPNYVDPAAREVSTQAPGAPLPPYPGDGRIYASWYEGYVEIPDNRCLVPRLRGRRPAAARQLLFEAGCTAGDVSRRPSRRALRGRVVGQQYRPGTRLSPSAEVGFTLGRRP